MEFIDQCKRRIALDQPPKRIVSLVPSQTEFLHDLGLEEEVVGITKFCIHPHSWFKSKQRVGGTKNLHIDKIRSLKPDLIIANKEENTKEQIEILADDFPIWISDIQNLEDAYEMMHSIGKICSRQAQASAIIDQIQNGFQQLKPQEKAISFLYLIWQDPYMACSSETFISSITEIMGLENSAFQLGKRYPILSEIQIEELQPALIFLSTEPYPFKTAHVDNLHKKFPFSKVLLVDGEMFSWYGSRLINSAEYLQNLQKKIKLLVA